MDSAMGKLVFQVPELTDEQALEEMKRLEHDMHECLPDYTAIADWNAGD